MTTGAGLVMGGIFVMLIILLQIAAVVAIIWIGIRFFDKRYKTGDDAARAQLLDGSLERTSEVFIDPKDGLKYRVYFNRQNGERTYVREPDN